MDYSELKKLAEESLPGHWEVIDDKIGHFWQVLAGCKLAATIPAGGTKNSESDLIQRRKTAEFIAQANAQVVLSLIAEVEALREQARDARTAKSVSAIKQAEGIAKAKEAGAYKGRKIDAKLHKRVRDLLGHGLGIRPTARHAKCSTSTVNKIRDAMSNEARSNEA